MQEDSTMRLNAVGLIVALALAIVVVPLAAEAQQPTNVYRIGWLTLGFPNDTFSKSGQARPDLVGLQQGLRELGYVAGQNLVIEARYAEGQVERLPDLATRSE